MPTGPSILEGGSAAHESRFVFAPSPTTKWPCTAFCLGWKSVKYFHINIPEVAMAVVHMTFTIDKVDLDIFDVIYFRQVEN